MRAIAGLRSSPAPGASVERGAALVFLFVFLLPLLLAFAHRAQETGPALWTEYKRLRAERGTSEEARLAFQLFHHTVEELAEEHARAVLSIGADFEAGQLETLVRNRRGLEWMEAAEELLVASGAEADRQPTESTQENAWGDFTFAVESLYYACFTLSRSALDQLLESDRPMDEQRALAKRARQAALCIGLTLERSSLDYEWVRLLRREGRTDEALRFLEELEDAHPDRVPYLALAEGELLRQRGRLRDALRATRDTPITEDSRGVELGLRLFRVEVFLDMGLPDLAAEEFREARRVFDAQPLETHGSESVIATVMMGLKVNQSLGDWEPILEDVRRYKDEEIFRSRPDRLAYLHFLEGKSLRKLERPEPERPLRAALGLNPPRWLQLDLRIDLTHIALARGTLDEAGAELNRAERLVLQWRQEDPGSLPFAAAEVPALAVRLALARGDSQEALLALRDPLQRAFEAMIERWANEERARAGSGLLTYRGRRAVVGAWLRLHLALNEPDAAIEAALPLLLRAQAQSTLARHLKVETPRVPTLRTRLLTDGRGLLLYLPDDDSSHLFAMDRGGTDYARLPALGEISDLAKAYRGHVADARGRLEVAASRATAVARERELARALAKGLLPDSIAQRVSGWSSAWVVGLENYGSVPIEWLPLGEQRFLGLACPLAHLPSLPVGIHLLDKTSERLPQLDLLLLGGVPFDARLGKPELPLDAPTRDHLSKSYALERVGVLVAERATKEAMAAELERGVTVLQVLVHTHHSDPAEVGLLFAAENGTHTEVLWRDQVAGFVAPQLALLLACGTGEGPTRRGDQGSTDFGGAWIGAGARAALVTQDKMGYATAVRLSGVLHERLAAGASPGMALRDALTDTAAADLETAPFRFGLARWIGVAHEPLFPERGLSFQRWAMAGGGLALAWFVFRFVTAKRRVEEPGARRRGGGARAAE